MALTSGSMLGRYEIVSSLGTGGMGAVYRARDLRLGREVAIKVLLDQVATDPERLARFEREARLLASLNHQNIAVLHGFERDRDTSFLVMEVVEGETLAERIARGPIDVDESVRLFLQVAEGLEAAHEQGVIHRDLKPANLKLAPDKLGSDERTVKILDFGIAKAISAETSTVDSADDTPTLPLSKAARTERGEILGTVAYMSPEQANGRAVDKRTDIWAFGLCLFETLTGQPAFRGDSAQETLAALLRDTPYLDLLPEGCPTKVRRLIERCLVKAPRDRLRDIGEARLELRSAFEPEEVSSSSKTQPPSSADWWLASVAAIVGLLLGMSLIKIFDSQVSRPTLDAPTTTWSEIGAPHNEFADHAAPSLSPDGSQVAFWAPDDKGVESLWLRELGARRPRILIARSATSTSGSPAFWSPNGKALAYFDRGRLMRVGLDGRAPMRLAEAPNHRGGSWASEDTIVFVPAAGEAVHTVSARTGGDARPLQLSERISYAAWPHVLPDQRHFLLWTGTKDREAQLWAVSLDGTEIHRLGPMFSRAEYSAGHVIYGHRGALMARPFDIETLALRGSPERIADHVGTSWGDPAAYSFSASPNRLVIWRGTHIVTTQLTWLDRRGQVLSHLGDPGQNAAFWPSPDGSELVVERFDPTQRAVFKLWLGKAMSGRMQLLRPEPAGEYQATPVWTPSGDHILYSTFPGVRSLSVASGSSEQISGVMAWVQDIAPDGSLVLLSLSDPESNGDLALLHLDDENRLEIYLRTTAYETAGRFSPDGRWIGYASDASGRFEVYVQPFRRPGRAVSVTPNGGTWPEWSDDGREIFFIGLDGMLRAVELDCSGSQCLPLREEALFFVGTQLDAARRHHWATDNGERILVNMPIEGSTPTQIKIIDNWASLLSDR